MLFAPMAQFYETSPPVSKIHEDDSTSLAIPLGKKDRYSC